MKKLKENATGLIVILTLIGLVFGAWFKMGETFTPIEAHQQLAVRVEQTAYRVEELKVMNDLRDYERQWKFCKPKTSDTCTWLKQKLDELRLLLQQIRAK